MERKTGEAEGSMLEKIRIRVRNTLSKTSWPDGKEPNPNRGVLLLEHANGTVAGELKEMPSGILDLRGKGDFNPHPALPLLNSISTLLRQGPGKVAVVKGAGEQPALHDAIFKYFQQSLIVWISGPLTGN